MEVNGYARPLTCLEGEIYCLRERTISGKTIQFRQVEFLSYSAHPALVVVKVEGSRIKVSRDDLFCIPEGEN